jgi:hypothetical protein
MLSFGCRAWRARQFGEIIFVKPLASVLPWVWFWEHRRCPFTVNQKFSSGNLQTIEIVKLAVFYYKLAMQRLLALG